MCVLVLACVKEAGWSGFEKDVELEMEGKEIKGAL